MSGLTEENDEEREQYHDYEPIVPVPFGRTREEKIQDRTKTLEMLQRIMGDDERNKEMGGHSLVLNK